MEILKDVKAPIESHPYTIDEVKEMLTKLNPLIVDALNEGKQIYVSKEFNEILNIFNELRKINKKVKYQYASKRKKHSFILNFIKFITAYLIYFLTFSTHSILQRILMLRRIT